jgi:hypothetical protein
MLPSDWEGCMHDLEIVRQTAAGDYVTLLQQLQRGADRHIKSAYARSEDEWSIAILAHLKNEVDGWQRQGAFARVAAWRDAFVSLLLAQPSLQPWIERDRETRRRKLVADRRNAQRFASDMTCAVQAAELGVAVPCTVLYWRTDQPLTVFRCCMPVRFARHRGRRRAQPQALDVPLQPIAWPGEPRRTVCARAFVRAGLAPAVAYRAPPRVPALWCAARAPAGASDLRPRDFSVVPGTRAARQRSSCAPRAAFCRLFGASPGSSAPSSGDSSRSPSPPFARRGSSPPSPPSPPPSPPPPPLRDAHIDPFAAVVASQRYAATLNDVVTARRRVAEVFTLRPVAWTGETLRKTCAALAAQLDRAPTATAEAHRARAALFTDLFADDAALLVGPRVLVCGVRRAAALHERHETLTIDTPRFVTLHSAAPRVPHNWDLPPNVARTDRDRYELAVRIVPHWPRESAGELLHSTVHVGRGTFFRLLAAASGGAWPSRAARSVWDFYRLDGVTLTVT